MQYKSFVEQKGHEMAWMKVIYSFNPENMSYPKLSHKKYLKKSFEGDIVLDNIWTLMFSFVQAQENMFKTNCKVSSEKGYFEIVKVSL